MSVWKQIRIAIAEIADIPDAIADSLTRLAERLNQMGKGGDQQ